MESQNGKLLNNFIECYNKLTKIVDKTATPKPNFNANESRWAKLFGSQKEQQMATITEVAINSMMNASNADKSACGTVWHTPYSPKLAAYTLVGVKACRRPNPSVAPIIWAMEYKIAIYEKNFEYHPQINMFLVFMQKCCREIHNIQTYRYGNLTQDDCGNGNSWI